MQVVTRNFSDIWRTWWWRWSAQRTLHKFQWCQSRHLGIPGSGMVQMCIGHRLWSTPTKTSPSCIGRTSQSLGVLKLHFYSHTKLEPVKSMSHSSHPKGVCATPGDVQVEVEVSHPGFIGTNLAFLTKGLPRYVFVVVLTHGWWVRFAMLIWSYNEDIGYVVETVVLPISHSKCRQVNIWKCRESTCLHSKHQKPLVFSGWFWDGEDTPMEAWFLATGALAGQVSSAVMQDWYLSTRCLGHWEQKCRNNLAQESCES